MHFKNENDLKTSADVNANANHTQITVSPPTPTTTSTSSSTSSSDSGVIIIDNKITFNKNNNKNSSDNSKSTTDDNVNKETQNGTPIYDKKFHKEKNNIYMNDNTYTAHNTHNTHNHNHNNNSNSNSNSNISKNQINIENLINITNTKQGENVNFMTQDDIGRPQHFPNMSETFSTNARSASKNCSPALSIRSTAISIISIDENAIDSSVVDSDSDCEADAEGVHGNYVVKKLGQQTTYSPDSPDLPNINKGLKVIRQQITPNGITPDGNGGNAGPLAPNMLNGNLTSPRTPQIGSIALTNSTDVTFGDKHFYEGPVMIQQFLIDSRDKWKNGENEAGQDNPSYMPDQNGNATSAEEGEAPKPVFPLAQQNRFYKYKAFIITGTIILLIILIGILVTMPGIFFKSSTSKNPNPEPEPEFDDNYNNTSLRLVKRNGWDAREPRGPLDKLSLPVHRVIISHTASESCTTRAMCKDRIQTIQNFHMDSQGWDDIGYNFLISSHGHVYEGRGWNYMGAHTKGFNNDSIGVSFIGTFGDKPPPDTQLKAAELLLEEGVNLKKLSTDYRLYGARQLHGTESPGIALYNIIKTWKHWREYI